MIYIGVIKQLRYRLGAFRWGTVGHSPPRTSHRRWPWRCHSQWKLHGDSMSVHHGIDGTVLSKLYVKVFHSVSYSIIPLVCTLACHISWYSHCMSRMSYRHVGLAARGGDSQTRWFSIEAVLPTNIRGASPRNLARFLRDGCAGGAKHPQHRAWSMFVHHQELLDPSSTPRSSFEAWQCMEEFWGISLGVHPA